jgi:hypothetical protein
MRQLPLWDTGGLRIRDDTIQLETGQPGEHCLQMERRTAQSGGSPYPPIGTAGGALSIHQMCNRRPDADAHIRAAPSPGCASAVS